MQSNNTNKEIFQTSRLTVPAIEEILGQEFPVLDHGFVRVVGDFVGVMNDDGPAIMFDQDRTELIP